MPLLQTIKTECKKIIDAFESDVRADVKALEARIEALETAAKTTFEDVKSTIESESHNG